MLFVKISFSTYYEPPHLIYLFIYSIMPLLAYIHFLCYTVHLSLLFIFYLYDHIFIYIFYC